MPTRDPLVPIVTFFQTGDLALAKQAYKTIGTILRNREPKRRGRKASDPPPLGQPTKGAAPRA